MNEVNKNISPKNDTLALKNPGGATLFIRSDFGAKNGKNKKLPLNKYKVFLSDMKIHPEGKISASREVSFQSIVERLKSNKDNFIPENRDIILNFIRDAKLGKTILIGQKKKVGEKRLLKYIQDLKKLDNYFKKPLDKITDKEMEDFIIALEEGLILSNKGKPFSKETEVVIKKLIKKFYKWLLGNSETTPKIVKWIDTSHQLKEYRAINKNQVETILNILTARTKETLIRNRALIIFLFDSGIRAEELLNIRIKHLSFENDNYKVRVEYSKTKPRTITLPFCKKYIDEWLDIHPFRKEQLAQLFPLTYINMKKIVQRAGKQINQDNLTPHSLRHSSATYWCQHLTPYELSYRFGWSMSSNQPQRYIDRNGLYQEKASKIVKAGQVEQLQQENNELNKRLARMEDQLQQLFGEDYKEARKIINIVKNELLIKDNN